MFSIIYRSKAAVGLPHEDILGIMRKSGRYNAKNDITGCLVYHRQCFIHLLEGDEEPVRSLFEKIGRDKRHRDISLLNLEENNVRLFSQFSTVYNNFDNISDQVRHKKMLFHQIFHGSEIVKSPGSSKLTLWAQVNNLLEIENKLYSG
ncbi:BLUF domain-containing protein [Maribacter algicola]|uniref:BLUF domain-containing protein n=1 Tax=Maribacter algicola TaxID=2498892 RepID=A0A3R8Q6S5_9FLAO|nr:BLUF domain-containing protein [Maribacter algicola]RRQ50646.1 BLUF domain-containing protein [Maribacter algicola]